MNAPQTIRQGHRYRLDITHLGPEVAVLALNSGECATVAELVPGEPWLGRRWFVFYDELTPLPMAYFHGDVPD